MTKAEKNNYLLWLVNSSQIVQVIYAIYLWEMSSRFQLKMYFLTHYLYLCFVWHSMVWYRIVKIADLEITSFSRGSLWLHCELNKRLSAILIFGIEIIRLQDKKLSTGLAQPSGYMNKYNMTKIFSHFDWFLLINHRRMTDAQMTSLTSCFVSL